LNVDELCTDQEIEKKSIQFFFEPVKNFGTGKKFWNLKFGFSNTYMPLVPVAIENFFSTMQKLSI